MTPIEQEMFETLRDVLIHSGFNIAPRAEFMKSKVPDGLHEHALDTPGAYVVWSGEDGESFMLIHDDECRLVIEAVKHIFEM